jgi:hypothetical protein
MGDTNDGVGVSAGISSDGARGMSVGAAAEGESRVGVLVDLSSGAGAVAVLFMVIVPGVTFASNSARVLGGTVRFSSTPTSPHATKANSKQAMMIIFIHILGL